ncbi:MAG: DUF72 domain-containing protein [Gemmatimonadetes bacterium]|nr:DUF72 domain-containing protein [Gemmatimonadota bacterium]
MTPPYYVGCAGWTLPRADQVAFAAEGTHLARYASRFAGAEINSSFHRPHRASTYERWAASVPQHFRFSVKLPKTITHARRLVAAEEELREFLDQVAGLGERLGCLLVQLPPSLEYEAETARAFFASLRAQHSGPVSLEPRHPSWFEALPEELMEDWHVSRVAADPARVPEAAVPGGSAATVYFRLHGSPRIYYSSYGVEYIEGLAQEVRSAGATAEAVWCIFDNTASGAATANALELLRRLEQQAPPPAGRANANR